MSLEAQVALLVAVMCLLWWALYRLFMWMD